MVDSPRIETVEAIFAHNIYSGTDYNQNYYRIHVLNFQNPLKGHIYMKKLIGK